MNEDLIIESPWIYPENIVARCKVLSYYWPSKENFKQLIECRVYINRNEEVACNQSELMDIYKLRRAEAVTAMRKIYDDLEAGETING